MKHLFRKQAIVLAALLQVLPICRTVCISPGAPSAFAIILRWAIGGAMALEAYDAYSGASAYYTNPTNFTGTVGTYFTNNITFTNTGAVPGSYISLSNSFGYSGVLSENSSTTSALPAGLKFTWVTIYYTNHTIQLVSNLWGAIYGTPTTAVTNYMITFRAWQTGSPVAQTNVWLNIAPLVQLAPIITNQPAGVTNVAGGSATFTVTAGGNAPLSYQWYVSPNNRVLNATNPAFSLTRIRASQSGGSCYVIITNSVGAVTSSPALLIVTNPLPPHVTQQVTPNKKFVFTFTTVPGLTNTIQTNGNLNSSQWGTWSNIAPPVSASSLSVTDSMVAPANFYRVLVTP